MKNQRLDIDALVEGRASIDDYNSEGFVSVPDRKEGLHPARYFEELFLPKAKAKGLDNKAVIEHLDISEKHFYNFLKEKVNVTMAFAKKLAVATGMPYDFWLRAQYKFDDTHNDYPNNAKPL
ncbi:MAG: hypothetical protein CL840_04840 [Crocinitomicaceae bacterium]|nr:hypothetical protein [Crocinitomicaceae bacterium]|tara:strand:+ start:6371 stop:6736 length:366 start_codon:yes stop_codon:yes gene_type:complete